jgi:hypothetical protein
MEKLTNAEFTELAYNNHREALLYLFARQNALEAEQDATQATVLDLATAINTPAEA